MARKDISDRYRIENKKKKKEEEKEEEKEKNEPATQCLICFDLCSKSFNFLS